MRRSEADAGLEQYLYEEEERATAEEIYAFLREKGAVEDCEEEMIPRIHGAITHLHDLGVEFQDYAGHSRRIVWNGRYGDREVVIKICRKVEDRRQQIKEEVTWRRATAEGDEGFFAEVVMADEMGDWLVQERCRDIWWYRRERDQAALPPEIRRLAEKYHLMEIQVGEDLEGNFKFVDYGR